MRKLPFIIGILIVFLLIQNAYATEYETTYWNDPCFISIPSGVDLSSFNFFSLPNQNKYIVLGFTAENQPRVVLLRLNDSCAIEDERREPQGLYKGSYVGIKFGNEILLSNNKVIIPYVTDNTLNFIKIDLNSYINGLPSVSDFYSNYSFSIGGRFYPLYGPIPDASLLITISQPMTSDYYRDLSNRKTFAVGYKSYESTWVCYLFTCFLEQIDKFYISYDFYDLDNDVINPNSMKTIDFSDGLYNVKKFYIIPTYGRCFQWSDCLFHVIYEGSSSQNNNRTGIYVREIHKTSSGYEFKDRGIIGFDSSEGFVNGQISGIIDWYYTCHYPNFCDKIYLRTQEGYQRMVSVSTFDTSSWVRTRFQYINMYDNNALVTNANGPYSYSVYCSQLPCFETWLNNLNIGNYNGKTYLSISFTTETIQHGSFRVDFYRSGTWCLDDSITRGFWGPGTLNDLVEVGLARSSYDLDIRMDVMAPSTITLTLTFDVFGSPSKFRYTLSPIGAEAFMVYPLGDGVFDRFFFQIPSSNFPLRTVCNDRISTTNEGLLIPGINSGSLVGGYDTKRYIVNVYPGSYNFSLCPEDGGGANYDTYLCLFDSSGNLIASNDDFCGLQSKISYNFTNSGTYYIQVSGYACNYGQYNLSYIRALTTTTTIPTAPAVTIEPSEFLNLIPMLLGNPLFFVAIFALAVAAKLESMVKAGGYAFVLTFLGIIFAFAVFSGIVPWWVFVILFVLIVGGIMYFKGK